MTDFYSQNRCVCSTRSHGPLLCAFCLSFHFNDTYVGFMMRHNDYHVTVPAPSWPNSMDAGCNGMM